MFTFYRETPGLSPPMNTLCHYLNFHLWEKHLIAAVDEPFLRKNILCLSASVLHEYMLISCEKIAERYPLVLALVCRCRMPCRIPHTLVSKET